MQDLDMARVMGGFSPQRTGYNTLVLGHTGSGKSYCVRQGIAGLSPEVSCYVIDFLGEYLDLAQAEGWTLLQETDFQIPESGSAVFDLHQEPLDQHPSLAAEFTVQLWRLAESDPRRLRLLVVDDAEEMLTDVAACEALCRIVTQGRRVKLGTVVTSGDLELFISAGADASGTSVLANSSSVLTLRIHAGWKNGVATALGLSDGQAERLTRCSRGEGLLRDHAGGFSWVRAPRE